MWSSRLVCSSRRGLARRSLLGARFLSSEQKKNVFGSRLPDVLGQKDAPDAETTGNWEQAWIAGETPWDAGNAPPLLEQLIQTGRLPKGRVLVPGCGAGYDAFVFARHGFEVVGLDVAPTAIRLCERIRKNDRVMRQLSPRQLSFREEDFFRWAPARPFDLIWDYTFLCALPPSLWPRWAKSMRRLVAPRGVLATLLFPVGDYKGGPPYALQPDKVEGLLLEAGFQCVELGPVAPENSIKPRAGREWFGLWEHDISRYPMLHPRKQPE